MSLKKGQLRPGEEFEAGRVDAGGEAVEAGRGTAE
jgi:hypothetical protein